MRSYDYDGEYRQQVFRIYLWDGLEAMFTISIHLSSTFANFILFDKILSDQVDVEFQEVQLLTLFENMNFL